MIVYDSAKIYLQSKTDLLSKISALDQIIDALILCQADVIETGSVSSYSLDDGQTKINQVYRNPLDVARSINAFEGIRQRYVNSLNGRKVRMVDEHNLTRFNNGCR